MDITKPNNIAEITPSIEKPATSCAVSKRRPTFITNVNRPNVRILIGKVSKTRIGFKNAFSTPSTTATIKAVMKSGT